jgi:hypothetical protein
VRPSLSLDKLAVFNIHRLRFVNTWQHTLRFVQWIHACFVFYLLQSRQVVVLETEAEYALKHGPPPLKEGPKPVSLVGQPTFKVAGRAASAGMLKRHENV